MQLVISNNDPVLTSVFRALAAHSSDPYRWLEVLRPALRWAESAADASEYSNLSNYHALSVEFKREDDFSVAPLSSDTKC